MDNKEVLVILGLVLLLGFVGFVSSECVDSDGGIDYYNGGSVRLHPLDWTNENGNRIPSQVDYCREGILSEVYCDELGNVVRTDYVCENGCTSSANGDACLRSFSENSFKDTYSSGEVFVLKNGETAGINFGNNTHSLTKLNGMGYVLDNPNKREWDVLVGKHEKYSLMEMEGSNL